jgi:16S rRNA (guanine1207-N2)-methyltransferase
MSHYFKEDKQLEHDIRKKEYFINDMKLEMFTDRGVFSKEHLDFGTHVLQKNVDVNDQIKAIIDMGCGYGPIGLYLAKKYPNCNIYMYDINERAVNLAKENKKLNQISNASVILSDLFDNCDVHADLIVTNPPIRAGKQTVFKLYEQAYEHLNQGGHFYCVIQKKQGAPSTYNRLLELFSNCTVIEKEKGYWILLAIKQ